jgi:hypothetical protein
LYRYNIRLAAFYDARADALDFMRTSLRSNGFIRLSNSLTPTLDFGRQPQTPIEQIKARRLPEWMYVISRYFVCALSEIGSLAVGFECFSSLKIDDVDHRSSGSKCSHRDLVLPTTVPGVAIR